MNVCPFRNDHLLGVRVVELPSLVAFQLIEHRDNTFLHHPVSSLCNTILLGTIPDTMLPLNAMIYAECLKLSRHVLATLIVAQAAQPFTSDILSPSPKLLESSKIFGLALQEINSLETRMVIDEGDPIAITLLS
jgi:hypothetical protein